MRSGDGHSNGITEIAIDDDDKTNYDNESSVNRRHVLGLEVDQQKKVRCGAFCLVYMKHLLILHAGT